MARILGIDVGRRRVGVAMSDPDARLSTGVTVLDVKKVDAIDALQELARENQAEVAVVGLPLNADGSEGPSAAMARQFGEALARRTGMEVRFHDERYTTVTAEEVLKEGGVGWKERKGLVDKLAAQLMLQGYLDATRS